MAHSLSVPDKQAARVKKVSIPVSTGKGEGKKEDTFEEELPVTLADAIALEGEKEVFKRYINSLVIYLQGKRRVAMGDKTAGKGRKRAAYMESLGL